ncbi:MAG: hypothetical protein LIP28_03630 [Deltaproteobacteria bacterium]|nr:hypothetical protein [Deltaproteobacteria bacterium]
MRKRIVFFGLVATLGLFAAFPVFAAQSGDAQPAVANPVADKPAVIQADRTTAVMVEHEGTDTLGAKLAFQLKGTFNTSSLFTLTEKDGPKIKVLLSTTAEFPSRPHIASAYSVTWAFSQADGTLSFLLAREVGLVVPEDLDSLVATLAERTDGMAAKYAYLFAK